MKRRAVLIHKTPSSWQKLEGFPRDEVPSMAQLESTLGKLQPSQIPVDILETDIYTALLDEIARVSDFDELHIIQGFDAQEKRNWQSAGQAGYAKLNERTTYFSIDNPIHLCAFLEAEVLFTRGRYPILHKELASHRSATTGAWVHYPATSLFFPHFDRFLRTWRQRLVSDWAEHRNPFLAVVSELQSEHSLKFEGLDVDGVLDGDRVESPEDLKPIFKTLERHRLRRRPQQKGCPYDLVLCDDSTSIAEVARIHPGAKVESFLKPALTRKMDVGGERTWDLVFCGTSLQTTKNLLLFGSLLRFLDAETSIPLRVAVIGNRGNVPEYDQAIALDYRNLEIEDMGEVTRSEALSIFNRARTLLITSGRDSNPRVIAEASLHGARIVALDLLSDGLEVIGSNSVLGAVIPSDVSEWRYARNGNLEISANAGIAQAVLLEVERSKTPERTADAAERAFNLTACAQALSRMLASNR